MKFSTDKPHLDNKTNEPYLDNHNDENSTTT